MKNFVYLSQIVVSKTDFIKYSGVLISPIFIETNGSFKFWIMVCGCDSSLMVGIFGVKSVLAVFKSFAFSACETDTSRKSFFLPFANSLLLFVLFAHANGYNAIG